MPNFSFRRTAANTVPNTTDVSRSAATSASRARVIAHRTSPYDPIAQSAEQNHPNDSASTPAESSRTATYPPARSASPTCVPACMECGREQDEQHQPERHIAFLWSATPVRGRNLELVGTAGSSV